MLLTVIKNKNKNIFQLQFRALQLCVRHVVRLYLCVCVIKEKSAVARHNYLLSSVRFKAALASLPAVGNGRK